MNGDRQCEWSVHASPDGSLEDLNTGREYPYLFWEADSDGRVSRSFGLDHTQSFCVAGGAAGVVCHRVSVLQVDAEKSRTGLPYANTRSVGILLRVLTQPGACNPMPPESSGVAKTCDHSLWSPPRALRLSQRRCERRNRTRRCCDITPISPVANSPRCTAALLFAMKSEKSPVVPFCSCADVEEMARSGIVPLRQ